MTLLRESAEREDEIVDEPPEPELDSTSRRDRRRDSRKRTLVIVVLIVFGALVTAALFAGPVESLWYRNRQHQLAADMNHARPSVAPGQAVAVLQVPRLGVNVVVIEGDNPERLRSGPGHHLGTARPGTRGNSIIMGHRSAWGGPFGALARVRRGDLVAVQTRAQKTVVYKVTSIRRAGAGARDTLVPRTSKNYELTLVTDRGGRWSDDRLIVSAVSGKQVRDRSGFTPLPVPASGPSIIFNLTLLMAVIAFALALGAHRYLRPRSGMPARAVVVIPLVVAGTLCLLLNLDLLLPPLV